MQKVGTSFILIMIVLMPNIASANTITVAPSGADYTTIQAAINAAASGDTISVAAGTYTENLEFTEYKHNLELIGAGASVPAPIQAATFTLLLPIRTESRAKRSLSAVEKGLPTKS